MKKGDFVRIRPDLVIGEEYGAVKMLSDMEDMKGCVGMVLDEDPAERTVKVGDWWWSVEMVHQVPKNPDVFGLGSYIIREIDKAINSLQRIIDVLK